MTGFALQRLNMVESQLRPNQVTDRRLLAAMGELPREAFVPASMRSFAYIDESVVVWPSVDDAPARYLLAPMVLARLIQLAGVDPSDRVLDVGCATGYSTAVLARLAGETIGLEPEPELAAAASKALSDLDLATARIAEGPLAQGHAPTAPYDVILLNGSVSEPPPALLAQLKEGGRLAAVVARGGQGKAYLFIKVDGKISGVPHFDAGASPLPGLAPLPSFAF